MGPKEIQRLRARLESERDELRAEGDFEIETEAVGETVDKVDEDVAPHAEMNQVIASNRNRARTNRLREIEDALRRLVEDPEAFGACEACDEPIPERRLALMPWVRLCIECQEEQETDGTPAGRRHITDYRP